MKTLALLSSFFLLTSSFAFAQNAIDGGKIPSHGVMTGGTDGANFRAFRISTTNKDQNAVAIGTIATVWTPQAGKSFRIMGGNISVSQACSVLFEDNTAGNFVFRSPQLLANTPYEFYVMGGQGKTSAAPNNVLKATASVAGTTMTGTLYGTEF